MNGAWHVVSIQYKFLNGFREEVSKKINPEEWRLRGLKCYVGGANPVRVALNDVASGGGLAEELMFS